MKTIRSQLILYFSIAILVPASITIYVGQRLISDQIITRAEMKTLSDLNSAREIYRNAVGQVYHVTRMMAVRRLIREAVLNRDADFLQRNLEATLEREHLDILTVTDRNGRVVARGSNRQNRGDDLRNNPFVEHVLRTRQAVYGTDVVPREQILLESDHLARQAAIDILPTAKAKRRTDTMETSAMMLKAAVPILEENGTFLGVLIGGVALNRNFEIVDKIKHVVHEGQVYEGMEIGTATIFLRDLRISTNVRNEDGSRAIGTLVSQDVYDAVLTEGRRWVGEAFVVNATYLAAYEPIKDPWGNTIGILYVGILKQPFTDLLRTTLMTFVGIAALGIVLIVFVSIVLAGRIAEPLRKLEEGSQRIADGDYAHRFPIKGPTEVAHLAASLNRMARELQEEKRELEQWAETLEEKVSERAEEIKRIHGQLFRSEKLASLGKLAAGVAHEINNPLTGILTNSSLLLEDLPPEDRHREEVAVIVRETIRCREIVKRLLDFARQTKPQTRLVSINALIENIVLLVRNQASFRNITIEKRLQDGLPELLLDPDQIQQVFINIVLNAAEAMAEGGRLTIESRISADGHALAVAFTDTGPGIPESERERIFDPFYTTKEHGTGLGLSISYGIVEQHGGTINVESTPGNGSTFTIFLPIQNVEPAEEA